MTIQSESIFEIGVHDRLVIPKMYLNGRRGSNIIVYSGLKELTIEYTETDYVQFFKVFCVVKSGKFRADRPTPKDLEVVSWVKVGERYVSVDSLEEIIFREYGNSQLTVLFSFNSPWMTLEQAVAKTLAEYKELKGENDLFFVGDGSWVKLPNKAGEWSDSDDPADKGYIIQKIDGVMRKVAVDSLDLDGVSIVNGTDISMTISFPKVKVTKHEE